MSELHHILQATDVPTDAYVDMLCRYSKSLQINKITQYFLVMNSYVHFIPNKSLPGFKTGETDLRQLYRRTLK